MTSELKVNTSTGSYQVVAGDQILEKQLTSLFSSYDLNDCFAFIDENVWKHHSSKLDTLFKNADLNARIFLVPEGESSKTIDWWEKGLDFLLENGVRRNTPLLAIGGGITGDLSGFVAASALRGIPLIHIPTTLLAMVDSSIGGKTGINHTFGKNLIGAFYAPEIVIADTSFLQTLPETEWINGLSEILKYGAISDSSIFDEAVFFLEEDFTNTNPAGLLRLITKCIRIKAEIVASDEFEGGKRAFLNFGHTFAHALEKAHNFDEISHGEAVFLGMLAAIELSNKTCGNLRADKIEQYKNLYKFNIEAADLNVDQLLHYMQSDKKRTGHDLRFILLEDWQHPVVKTVTNEGLIKNAWKIIAQHL